MLNMHMHPAHYNASGNSNDVVLEINAFAKMSRLKLLQLCHVQLNGCYEEFPKGLRWLCWFKSHLQFLPNDFPMKSLVGLEMCYSSLRQVWEKSEVCYLIEVVSIFSPIFIFYFPEHRVYICNLILSFFLHS